MAECKALTRSAVKRLRKSLLRNIVEITGAGYTNWLRHCSVAPVGVDRYKYQRELLATGDRDERTERIMWPSKT